MKSFNLTIILCGFCLISYTQNNKLAIGVLGAFDKYSQSTGKFGFGSTREYQLKAAYSYGLQAQYNFNEKYFIRIGFLHSVKGYNIPQYNFIAIDGTVNDPAIPQSSKVKYNSVVCPVMYGGYYKRSKKLKLSAAIGAVNEFVYQTKEESTSGDGSVNATSHLSKGMSEFYFSGQINLGAEYHFNEKIYMSAEPYFRYLFNEFGFGDGLMEFSSISYGSFVGLHYKLFIQAKEVDLSSTTSF